MANPSSAAPSPADESVARILEAAGAVLDEVGYEGFSTTAVAQRAGVSTRTVYRHFPDKFAILRALVVSLLQERGQAMRAIFARLSSEPDWRSPLDEAVRLAWTLRTSRPGGNSIRRALQMSPELWQWDHDQDRELASALGKALRKRNPELSAADARRVAFATLRTMSGLLDLAWLEASSATAIVDEAVRLGEAYLARYLD